MKALDRKVVFWGTTNYAAYVSVPVDVGRQHFGIGHISGLQNFSQCWMKLWSGVERMTKLGKDALHRFRVCLGYFCK